jgi:hypothetical protein
MLGSQSNFDDIDSSGTWGEKKKTHRSAAFLSPFAIHVCSSPGNSMASSALPPPCAISSKAWV